MRAQPPLIKHVDQEGYDGAGGKRQRRPDVKLLDRQTDEQRAHERADDRAEAANAELPAGAIGAQLRRIDHRADDIDAGLDAEHQRAGEKRRDE